MPLIGASTYLAPTFLQNGHLLTVYPRFFRSLPVVPYRRERIATPDDDFLDLDWVSQGNPRLAILSHGLEGSSQSQYILGMAAALRGAGWDALAWNCRSCSGEINRRLRFYHSGATDDLDTVVAHVLQHTDYAEVALIGFSLGGNLTLKYLGERGDGIDARVKRAVAFSVPCDLQSSSLVLARPSNRIYMTGFLVSLQRKIREKSRLYPGRLEEFSLRDVRSFKHFDDRYTAPLHGFRSAEDYWERASSKPFLQGIRIPTLLVNARDDPFLAPPCFPEDEARDHPFFHFEAPSRGGHVGYVSFNGDRRYWSEKRALDFL